MFAACVPVVGMENRRLVAKIGGERDRKIGTSNAQKPQKKAGLFLLLHFAILAAMRNVVMPPQPPLPFVDRRHRVRHD
jgi:hypothetical protein